MGYSLTLKMLQCTVYYTYSISDTHVAIYTEKWYAASVLMRFTFSDSRSIRLCYTHIECYMFGGIELCGLSSNLECVVASNLCMQCVPCTPTRADMICTTHYSKLNRAHGRTEHSYLHMYPWSTEPKPSSMHTRSLPPTSPISSCPILLATGGVRAATAQNAIQQFQDWHDITGPRGWGFSNGANTLCGSISL